MTIQLPADPTSAAVARRAVREACDGAAVDLDEVLLCASELVTNAVLHGRPPIELEIHLSPGSLRVSVHDGAGGPVELRRPATPDTSAGRGLHIVQTVATRWGTSARKDGKTAWFEFDTGQPEAAPG